MAKRRVASDAPKLEKPAKPKPKTDDAPPAGASAPAGPRLPRGRSSEPAAGAVPEFGDREIKEAVGKAKARHACKCPNCSYRFVYRQDGAMPENLPCPSCFREFAVERFLTEEQKLDPTFGPTITCANVVNGKACGQTYRRKAQGAGGADLEAGTGGYDRACPKCGANPPDPKRNGRAKSAEALQEDFDATQLPKR